MENVDQTVLFCDGDWRLSLLLDYALYCNGLSISATKPERNGEKNIIYNSYST